jgi:dihydrodipicolinate synthase/N-acetylneuraminate lyase
MENNPKISGVLPVLQIPYRENDTIDYDVLSGEMDFVIECGCDGVVLALASDLMRLTHEERLELTAKIPEMVAGRVTVTISCGAETIKNAVRYALAAEHAGAQAVMAIPPISNKLPENEVFEYYKAIHDAIDIPLVIQDASGYLGQSLSMNLLVRLRNDLSPRIYYKPEAPPIGQTISRIQKALRNEGVIFEGMGGLQLIDSYRRGISGTMPGCDLIKGMVELWQALLRGDEKRTYEIYFPLAAIVVLQLPTLDAFLSIGKYLLMKQGVFRNRLLRRPSNYELDTETSAEIDRLFALYEKALGK